MTRRISTTTVMVLVGEVVNMGKRKLLLASGLASGFPFFCFVASRLPFFGVFFVSGCPFFHDCSQLDTLCRAVSCTQQTVNFLERKSRTMRKRWFQNPNCPRSRLVRKKVCTCHLGADFQLPTNGSNFQPNQLNFPHTTTNQPNFGSRNQLQPTKNQVEPRNQFEEACLPALPPPPPSSWKPAPPSRWTLNWDGEYLLEKKTNLSRSFKIHSNTEGRVLIWVQGSGKA